MPKFSRGKTPGTYTAPPPRFPGLSQTFLDQPRSSAWKVLESPRNLFLTFSRPEKSKSGKMVFVLENPGNCSLSFFESL